MSESGAVVEKGAALKRAASELKGRKALVAGLAATGLSVARFLVKCGADVRAYDSRPMESLPGADVLEGMGVSFVTGAADPGMAGDAALVVVSPGVPFDNAVLVSARKRGAVVISEVELAFRYADAPVVAIAGTNGKTTTTELVGAIFKKAGMAAFVGGNIGTPAIEYIEGGGGADVCVLEISSFHLETTDTFAPHIGALLNITEDHLDRYDDFNHYAETKFRLFMNQGEGDYAVVNVNDPVIAGRFNSAGFGRGMVVPFSARGELKEGLFFKDGAIEFRFRGLHETYPSSGFKLRGLHNIENIMAAIACTRLLGVKRETILEVLSTFTGLPHRMEFVRLLDGVTYVDDSKGTNIGALAMALTGTETPVVLIAGGRDKGGDYASLSSLVKEKVKCMVLIGEARFKIKDSLGSLTETVFASSIEEAAGIARGKAAAGDTVLLCPACSSFDMFSSYKERGERFSKSVEAL